MTKMLVRITNVHHGFFKDTVTIKALSDCDVIYDSALGYRKFYLNKGCKAVVKLKKYIYQNGDIMSFSSLIQHVSPFKFNWHWCDRRGNYIRAI